MYHNYPNDPPEGRRRDYRLVSPFFLVATLLALSCCFGKIRRVRGPSTSYSSQMYQPEISFLDVEAHTLLRLGLIPRGQRSQGISALKVPHSLYSSRNQLHR